MSNQNSPGSSPPRTSEFVTPSDTPEMSVQDFMRFIMQRLDGIDARLDRSEKVDVVPKESDKESTPTLSPKPESPADADLLPDENRLPPSFDSLHEDTSETVQGTNPMRASSRAGKTKFAVEDQHSTTIKSVDAVGIPVPSPSPKERRSTIFERSAIANLQSAQTLVYQANQPDYGHIKLSVLRVGPIFTFFEALDEYQTAHNLKLKAPMLVSTEIRNKICNRFSKQMKEIQGFTDIELYNHVRSFVVPDSKVEFFRLMNSAVDFNIRASYRPSAEHYRNFYDALLAFKNIFIKTYEMLAADNDENIPDCKYRPGGLIKCFVDKVPFEYGTRVLQELSKARIEQSVYIFLADFYTLVETHKHCHLKARHLSQFFGGTAYDAAKKTDKSLSNIQLAEDLDDYGDPVPLHDEPPEESDEHDEQPEEPAFEDSYDDDPFDDDLAAMQMPVASRPAAGGTGPCFMKVNTGRCDKPGCAFSHAFEVIKKARDEKIAHMNKLNQPPPKVGVSASSHRKN